jgi:glycerol-3-phosphate dehydrogenase (NAD(P)+)|tara:strand:- start:56 stop:1051 length:996 start_codon:yes stop_codon:yes gene_type:complete
MAKIIILGAGSMGTAFSYPCSDNNHDVTIIGTHLEDDFIDLINSQKKHPILDCGIAKNVKFLKLKNLSEEINKKVDLIVVAVVSKGIEWASLELCKVLKNNVPILILTKGLSINNNNYEILAHKIERILRENGIKKTNISAAGGPCLAKDLATKVHTSVVFANTDINVVNEIKKIVSTDYYHVSTTDDVIGVEVCAAIKNIFSIGIGSTKDLNAAAGLIQQSIDEMIIFTETLKGKKETVIGLAGIGDLYVSADGGRNSKMGKYLGQGLTFQEAKKTKMPKVTVEGAELIFEIGSKVKKDFDETKLPLMIAIINTILNDKKLDINWDKFNL